VSTAFAKQQANGSNKSKGMSSVTVKPSPSHIVSTPLRSISGLHRIIVLSNLLENAGEQSIKCDGWMELGAAVPFFAQSPPVGHSIESLATLFLLRHALTCSFSRFTRLIIALLSAPAKSPEAKRGARTGHTGQKSNGFFCERTRF